MKKFFALSLSDVVFIMLINVKMPTNVGILTFMIRINFGFCQLKHEKNYNLGASCPDKQHVLSIKLCLFISLFKIVLYNYERLSGGLFLCN